MVASYARPTDQDDLAQDIAFAVWQALPGFRGECSERTFAFRIAHNRGLSYVARRRIAREATGDEAPPEIADTAPGPETRAADRQDVERLFVAIRALPVALRQVLTLALEDMPHVEIAACLGISVENVAVRLSRARAALRREMETP
ncbi:RNA polymerase sigma-70 factor, ECF subfamily protein [Minicystis rosea]|nr:RNA polymerase sigma-70 factor, ECF subfamily protein [Minicystis rosea]